MTAVLPTTQMAGPAPLVTPGCEDSKHRASRPGFPGAMKTSPVTTISSRKTQRPVSHAGDTTALPPQQETEKNPRKLLSYNVTPPSSNNYNQTRSQIKEMLLPCVRISNKTPGLILNYSFEGHENPSTCFLTARCPSDQSEVKIPPAWPVWQPSLKNHP